MRDGLAATKASETQEKQSLDKQRDRSSLKRVKTNTGRAHSVRDGSLRAVTDRRCDTCLLSRREQHGGCDAPTLAALLCCTCFLNNVTSPSAYTCGTYQKV